MRMCGDERLDLAHEGGVPPFLQIQVDPSFEGGEPRFVEPRRLRARERRVRDVRERRPAPERERLSELLRTALREVREPLGVELGGLDPDEVPRCLRDDPVGSERAAESVDVHLEGVLGARGRRLAPDPVDEAVGRDRAIGLQEEPRQERTRPWAAEGDGQSVVADHLQRPQQPELHPLRPLLALLKPRLSGS